MAKQHLFDYFRRQQVNYPKAKDKSFWVQLDFDDHGAFVAVVDKKGNPLVLDYRSFDGPRRRILQLLEQMALKQGFIIDWEKPDDRNYLAGQEDLLQLLITTDLLVDRQFRRLKKAQGQGRLKLHIQEQASSDDKESNLTGTLQLDYKGKTHTNYQVINQELLLVDQDLVNIPNLGPAYSGLNYFNTKIRPDDLSIYLSLFFSNLQQIDFGYEDYQLVRTKEQIPTQACLIFDQVDEDQALVMRMAQYLPGLPLDALELFDLTHLAELSDLEKQVRVYGVEPHAIEDLRDELQSLLKKRKVKSTKASEKAEVIFEAERFIIPKEIASTFIYEDLPLLLSKFQLFGVEQLKAYKVVTKQPSLIPSLNHGIDFFEGSIDLDFGEERMSLQEVIAQFRKQRYIQLSDGSHALLDEAYIRRLERIIKKEGDQLKVSFFDLPLIEELIDERTAAPFLQKTREVFEGFNQLAKRRMRLPDLKAQLRPYQKQGYKWLRYLQEQQLGGCLADDMGLGKTLQTIALLASFYPKEEMPSLIVMPRSLLFNWANEVARFAPQLKTYTFYGNQRDIEAARKAHLVFTTYAMMRNQIEVFREVDFFYVILDESQNIKNVNAQTTKAAMLLDAQHRLALSGTPIENNLSELYSLFRFLNPAMFGSFNQFKNDYLGPIQKMKDQDALQALRKKIYPFVLRRLKQQVLKDLPDKIEQTLMVEMTDEQKRLYEQRRRFYRQAIEAQVADKGILKSQFFIFQAFTELRQIASVPERLTEGEVVGSKRELLMEQLLDTIANGHKALVFVNFLAAIEMVSEQLAAEGIDFVSMTGATRNRQALVDRFQQDPNCKVFLMTLKTGGTGLNLTAADTIFLFDPWWNVAAENQAIDRAHRIGQKNKVLAYRLIAAGSIEEKIVQLQALKRELFNSVISSDGAALKSISEEDLAFILGR
ncbi:MAG: DEAD/DEAH box helicase [Bacteroidota bacterium]